MTPRSRFREDERDSTVLRYRYLCSRGARRFARRGFEANDLEQVASIALVRAVDRYDAARGTPFEAFAWAAIVGELRHHVRDHDGPLRVPRALREGQPRLRRAAETLVQRLGRDPSEFELARELDLPVASVRAMRRAALAGAPPLPAEETRAVRDVADADVWSARIDLERAFATLSARDRRVVVGVDLLGLTHGEVASRLALSSRHVARLRAGALARLGASCGVRIPA